MEIKSFTYKNLKYHLVCIVNDGEQKLYVFKFWLKYKQYWGYEVWEDWQLEYYKDDNLVTNIKYEKESDNKLRVSQSVLAEKER